MTIVTEITRAKSSEGRAGLQADPVPVTRLTARGGAVPPPGALTKAVLKTDKVLIPQVMTDPLHLVRAAALPTGKAATMIELPHPRRVPVRPADNTAAMIDLLLPVRAEARPAASTAVMNDPLRPARETVRPEANTATMIAPPLPVRAEARPAANTAVMNGPLLPAHAAVLPAAVLPVTAEAPHRPDRAEAGDMAHRVVHPANIQANQERRKEKNAFVFSRELFSSFRLLLL